MKNIRFKAKCIRDGKWVSGYYVHLVDERNASESHRIYTGCAEAGAIDLAANWHEIDPETICELTGLKDQNGKEIWEGDIVRYRCTDWRYKKNAKYTNAIIVRDKYGWTLKDFFKPEMWETRFEILGNIFDNPELISTQK